MMRLLRVRVPDFRSLKNIDIRFEKDFSPNIFPIGGQSGSAKSTLLQVIFICLHGSGDRTKSEFIQKLLDYFDFESERKTVAIFEIWDGERTVTLEFAVCKYNSFKASIDLVRLNKKQTEALQSYQWLTIEERWDLDQKIRLLNADLNELHSIRARAETLAGITEESEREQRIEREIEACNQLHSRKKQWISFVDRASNCIAPDRDFHAEVIALENRIEELLFDSTIKRERYESRLQVIAEQLRKKNEYFITDFINEQDKCLFFCTAKTIEFDRIESFLRELSRRVYLSAPSTHFFLFINSPIKTPYPDLGMNAERNYEERLSEMKETMPHFFTYDLFTLDVLNHYSSYAGHRPAEEGTVIEAYQKKFLALMKEVEKMFGYQKKSADDRLPEPDSIRAESDNHRDPDRSNLTYSEFKRLNIYVWLKYRKIENSIVLMDDIEGGLPADWQGQLSGDLQAWEPTNQYILATRSPELCQSLPGKHLKSIEFKKYFEERSKLTKKDRA